MGEKQLFSIQETAERWGVSPYTIRRLIEAGDLRSVTIAARRLVPLPEIERCELAGTGTPCVPCSKKKPRERWRS